MDFLSNAHNNMNTGFNSPQWYVVYTRPKAEKKVVSSITELGIESYLPTCKVVRQWSDRKKSLEVPLFPNYVFVKIDHVKRGSLYSIKNLVRFISIENKPVVVEEKVIAVIKRVLSGDVDVFAEDYFQEGMRVKIKWGPFAGLEGIVDKRNSASKLIIKIDGLMKAFSFNVSAHLVEPVAAINSAVRI